MSTDRRVLFVHNGPLHRDVAGNLFAVHYSNPLVERYRSLGRQVTFLMRQQHVPGDPGGLSPLDAPNFSFIAVPDIVRPWAKLRNLRAARRLIRSAIDASDVIVARLPSATSSLAIRIAREQGKPCLVECVGCNWAALWNHNWKGKLGAAWYAAKQRRLIRKSPFVMYVTQEFLQRRYPTRGASAAISDVAIGTLDPQVLRRRMAAIDALEARPRPLRLATIADLSVRYKAQSDVIAAVRRLKARGVRVEYHLIGGGEPSRLVRLARRAGVEDQVTVLGVVGHAEIFRVLETIDLYVHPSHVEALPRVVVEALSVGLPAIAARTGGVPELLPDSRLFPPGAVSRIVDLIASLQAPKQLRGDALRNWDTAHRFQSATLDRAREAFFERFLDASGFGPEARAATPSSASS